MEGNIKSGHKSVDIQKALFIIPPSLPLLSFLSSSILLSPTLHQPQDMKKFKDHRMKAGKDLEGLRLMRNEKNEKNIIISTVLPSSHSLTTQNGWLHVLFEDGWIRITLHLNPVTGSMWDSYPPPEHPVAPGLDVAGLPESWQWQPRLLG